MNIVIIKIISLSDIFPRSVSFFARNYKGKQSNKNLFNSSFPAKKILREMPFLKFLIFLIRYVRFSKRRGWKNRAKACKIVWNLKINGTKVIKFVSSAIGERYWPTSPFLQGPKRFWFPQPFYLAGMPFAFHDSPPSQRKRTRRRRPSKNCNFKFSGSRVFFGETGDRIKNFRENGTQPVLTLDYARS